MVSRDQSTVQVSGWLDTVDHRGYGLISGKGIQQFLSFWDLQNVYAQGTTALAPPLPVPTGGWEKLPLQKDDSLLAAAQLLMVGLASDRPENPQLLLQSGAKWLRADTVAGTPVDVVSGPIPQGGTESSYRYWIDKNGKLRRVEARLDGMSWSIFTLTEVSGITLKPPS